MTMTYGEKMALKTPVSREEAERVLAKEGIGCGAVMALRFARTLLATMTELEQVKGERDYAVEVADRDHARATAAEAAMTEREGVLEQALRNLVGPDCMYDGRNIVITAVSHSDAIRLVADARAALQHKDATHGPE